MSTTTGTHRFEWATFEGMWTRELMLFKRYWASTTVSSVLQPVIYLLAFGLGVGTMIASVDGISYVEFVGTGSVATAVLFASAFPGMFNTYVRRVFQRTYDGILAAPVDVAEMVTAEASWIAVKAGLYGSIPLDRHDVLRAHSDLGDVARTVHRDADRAWVRPVWDVGLGDRQDHRRNDLCHVSGSDAPVPDRRNVLPDHQLA